MIVNQATDDIDDAAGQRKPFSLRVTIVQ